MAFHNHSIFIPPPLAFSVSRALLLKYLIPSPVYGVSPPSSLILLSLKGLWSAVVFFFISSVRYLSFLSSYFSSGAQDTLCRWRRFWLKRPFLHVLHENPHFFLPYPFVTSTSRSRSPFILFHAFGCICSSGEYAIRVFSFFLKLFLLSFHWGLLVPS